MNRTIKARLTSLARRTERAVAAIEFALTAPVLVAMLIGMIDVGNFLLMAERVDRISFTVTDMVTQSESVSKADLATILLAADQLMNPYDFTSDGVVIISSLYKDTTGKTTILWQYAGGGGLARTSKLGVVGAVPNLPTALTLNTGDNVIVAEVYYAFTPLFLNAGILSATDLYHAAYFKPRLSQLTTTPT
jgi:Flp pilus assembly protein TadG